MSRRQRAPTSAGCVASSPGGETSLFGVRSVHVGSDNLRGGILAETRNAGALGRLAEGGGGAGAGGGVRRGGFVDAHVHEPGTAVAVGARIFHAGERVRASRGGAPSEVGGRAESDAGDGASAGELRHVEEGAAREHDAHDGGGGLARRPRGGGDGACVENPERTGEVSGGGRETEGEDPTGC